MPASLHLQQRTSFVILACIGLAALWDVLFWGRPLGVSVAIFAAMLGLLLVLRAPALWKSVQGRIAMIFALVTVIALVEEPSRLAILMVCVSGTTLILVAQRDLNLIADSVGAWIFRTLALFITLWLRLILDNVLVARWLVRHPRLGGRIMRAATFIAWWILPLLAGTVFAGLFAFANPVIARFFSHLLDHIADWLTWVLQLSFLRIFLWMLVAALTYGILRYRHMWRRKAVILPPVVAPARAAWLTGPQMIIRVLLILNLLFALENILDAMYLYFNMPLPEGLTYKEYAHRGAYTLIATALLAAFFTLLAFRPRGGAHQSRICRGMVYAWILQNILLLVSTVWRVCEYVDIDKLTRLRLSTMIWCGIVAAGFCWIIARIMFAKTNAWLLRMNAFTALAILLACTFVNFDGIISDFNVRHCAESGGHGSPLDLFYLGDLGPQALPAAAWMSQHPGTLDPPRREWVTNVARELKQQYNDQTRDWRGWTFRRWREIHGPEAQAIANLQAMPHAVSPDLAGHDTTAGPIADRSPSWH